MELLTRAWLRLPQVPNRLLLARVLERVLRFPFNLARGTSGAAWLWGTGQRPGVQQRHWVCSRQSGAFRVQFYEA